MRNVDPDLIEEFVAIRLNNEVLSREVGVDGARRVGRGVEGMETRVRDGLAILRAGVGREDFVVIAERGVGGGEKRAVFESFKPEGLGP